MHESLVDAVDGSSTGTRVPRMWALLRLPRFRGAIHADSLDNRSRHRQVGLSGPRRRCWWPGDYPSPVEASLRPGVLSEVTAMPDRYRSLRLVAPLVAGAASTWSYGTADASGLRQTLCQTAEE